MSSILVTGGAGFLGAHLCRLLLEQGHEVTCLDNLSTGAQRRIVPLMRQPLFHWVEHDVCADLAALLPTRFDRIYNLACPASPVHYQRAPIETTRTCVVGALQVLSLARRDEARVLQASTSEVYGDPAVHPQPESYWGHVNPTGPRACYDEGKRCAEALFFDHARQHGTDIRVARLFNTYGPGMSLDDGRVVTQFAVQALRDEPITIHGDGRQTRSFCYVADMVQGIAQFMEQAPATGPMNLGTTEECTILELAHAICAAAGSDSPVRHVPGRADDPRQRRPDLSLARRLIGWAPRVGLTQGLGELVAHCRREIAQDSLAG